MATTAPPGFSAPSGRSPPGEAPPPPPAGLDPPGLWPAPSAPPGFGPSSPSLSPATGSAANADAAALAHSRELELQKEISGTIEAQVHRLIEHARQDTEAKVKAELKSIHMSMMVIDKGLDQLVAQLDGVEPQEPAEQPMDGEAVGQLLSKIEHQWGQEIRTLKQELHQTILAHNHNADLIKHHKDTIDALRERCVKMRSSSTKTSEIQLQLQKLDARLKQQQKQRKLEPLFERLSALEHQVAAVVTTQGAAWPRGYPGVPPMVPPGMGVPPGISPGMMPGLGAPMPGFSSSAAAKKAAATQAAHAMAAAQAAAAAIPGAASAAVADKFKCPTDEEVNMEIVKLALPSEDNSLPSLAAELNGDVAKNEA